MEPAGVPDQQSTRKHGGQATRVNSPTSTTIGGLYLRTPYGRVIQMNKFYSPRPYTLHELKTTGEVSCPSCKKSAVIRVDLGSNYRKVVDKLKRMELSGRQHTAHAWLRPILDIPCRGCFMCLVKPCLPKTTKKYSPEGINWLFLYLTETLGLVPVKTMRKYLCSNEKNPLYYTWKKEDIVHRLYYKISQQLELWESN